MKKKILVLCTGNSCRSQMAEGYLRHFHGDATEVYSAGVEAHGLNPRALLAMAEDGVDISSHTSDLVDQYLGMDSRFATMRKKFVRISRVTPNGITRTSPIRPRPRDQNRRSWNHSARQGT